MAGKALHGNTAELKAAIAMHQHGQLDLAEEVYKGILQSQPRHFDALHLLATLEGQRRNSAAALGLFDRALKINPAHAGSHNNRGNALRDLQRFEEALDSYNRALKIKPDYVEALNNRGNVLRDLGRFEEALESFDRALRIEPAYADAWLNRGNASRDLGRLDTALESYDRALQVKPDYAEALYNRGGALLDHERFEEALQCYDRVLAIRPDYAEALNNRGNALRELERLEEALRSYDFAVKVRPDYAEAFNNRGNTLWRLKRIEEALASYDSALRIRPDYPEALFNCANALRDLKRLDAALQCYERALAIKPDYVEALYNRGSVLSDLNRPGKALDSYESARRLNADEEYLLGIWLQTKMTLVEWDGLESGIARLAERISSGEKASPPFVVLAMTGDLRLQRKAAETWVRDHAPRMSSPLALAPLQKRARHDRLRVGYFSADFRNHAVAYLTAELFERHDRQRFEVIGFSFGPDSKDEMRIRMEAAFDRFIDVRDLSDRDVAALARTLEIDIAVDLGGHTRDSRTGVFAMRAAPLQAAYLGSPGTTGAEYMDYLVADATIIPEADRAHYSEKIVYLPSYQVNDTKRRIADRAFTRQELGLPETGFVFCCFNNSYKITPKVFDSWMRILGRVEGSVLWLSTANARAKGNLRKEAASRGVDPERLVFAERMPHLADHLARYRAADLFLDTLPYNAQTTASDALWAGLPVLTCIGEAFAGRVAASLLNAIGLPELVATTPEAYESAAIDLAVKPGALGEARRKLANNRLTKPLFDIGEFTRNLEAAYSAMDERYRAGLPPAHIHVSSRAEPPVAGGQPTESDK